MLEDTAALRVVAERSVEHVLCVDESIFNFKTTFRGGFHVSVKGIFAYC